MMGQSAELKTSDDFGVCDLRLVELNEEVEKAIVNGEDMYFCGSNQQDVVLCTATRSFKVVSENTSNTSLLLPHGLPEKENQGVLAGSTTSFYKLNSKEPDVNAVKELLQENPYDPLTTTETGSYSLETLAQQFQVSYGEMQCILDDIEAININGCWVIVDPLVIQRTFSIMLDHIIENEWPIQSNITLEQFVEKEKDIPKIILDQCLNIHSIKDKSEPSRGSYLLDPQAIAKFRAIEILTDTNGAIPYSNFLESWAIRLPEGIELDQSYLQGLAFISDDDAISYFPQHHLSTDPEERFQQLFAFSSEWTLSQLKPYVEPLGSDTMELLGKYTTTRDDIYYVKQY